MMQEYFIFPFENVNKNSKVIIYGAGKAGFDYLSQIKVTNWCEFLFFVDKRWAELKNDNIHSIDAIKETSYDYIVISLQNQHMSHEVFDDLLMLGVDRDKIIIKNDRRIDNCPMTKFSLTTMCENTDKFKQIIDETLRYKGDQYKFISPIVKELEKCTPKEFERFSEYIFNYNLEHEYRIFGLFMLHFAHKFDKNLMKILVELISIYNDFDTKYALSSSIDVLAFRFPEYIYPQYYACKEKIQNDLVQSCNFKIKHFPFKKINEGKMNLVIVVSRLLDESDSVTHAVLSYVELLKDNTQITLVVADEYCIDAFQKSDIDWLLKNPRKSIEYYEFHKHLFKDIKVIYNEGKNLIEISNWVVDKMYEINPDIVLNIGASQCLGMSAVSAVYPCMFLPINSAQINSFCHKYIVGNKNQIQELNKKYNIYPMGKVIEIPYCSICGSKSEKNIKREENNINSDDFVLVTVSNRLEIELKEDFVDMMCELLRENKRIRWIIVGKNPPDNILREEHLVQEKQIILWGYENNLKSLYKICDLYVNPNRIGGGLSIRWAMEEGLPIAVNHGLSDGAQHVGVENAIPGGYKELCQYIKKAYSDKEFYKKESDKMLQKAKVSNELAKYMILKECRSLINDFKKGEL